MFVGTAPFAVPALRSLRESGHEIALVVTQPDRPGHRRRLTEPAVKPVARELGLEVFQPERIRAPEAVDRVGKAGPELLVVVAYGQILPPDLLQIPVAGTLNVHASLLPRWRGAAPVAHAILAGDRLTGVTIMRMDEQLDHGPVLAATPVEIAPGEEAPALSARLAVLGAEVLVDCLGRLDQLDAAEQDHDSATLAPRLSRRDGELDWTLEALEIDRRVRALQPWPGVTLPYRGARLKVLRGRPLNGFGPAGRVLAAGPEGVEVAAGAGSYRLEEVQLPGRRPIPARLLAAGDA